MKKVWMKKALHLLFAAAICLMALTSTLYTGEIKASAAVEQTQKADAADTTAAQDNGEDEKDSNALFIFLGALILLIIIVAIIVAASVSAASGAIASELGSQEQDNIV